MPSVAGFLQRCLAYALPHWTHVLLFALVLVPTTACLVLQPLVFRAIVDDAIVPRDGGQLPALVAVLAGLVGLQFLGELGKRYVASRLAATVVSDLRLRIFEALQNLSLGFHGRTQVSDLMSRYTADLSAVETAITLDVPNALSRALNIVASLLVMFLVAWQLGVWTLGLLIALYVTMRILGPMAERARQRRLQDAARVDSAVREHVALQPVLHVFGLYDSTLARLRREADLLDRSSVRLGLLGGVYRAALGVGGTSLRLLAIAIGGFLVLGSGLSLGTLVAAAELLWYVVDALEGLTAAPLALRPAAVANTQIEELLANAQPRVTDAPDAQRLPPFSREIRFHGVTYSYSGIELSLRGVSFTIARGRSVAFVGPSGCGKSTVLGLLLRLLEPTAGYITIDGWDLRQVTQESLRSQMGVVFRDNFLFSSTLRENIRVGRPSASDAEVEAAAKQAEIHDFVASLPRGYDTPISEAGGALSVGQRQRIALARAILRDPAIFVLDEATSALDVATEAAINTTLEAIARGRTVVTVTHRLSTVTQSDLIFVLDHGEIVQRGRHEELLASEGPYRDLWQKQSGLMVDEEGSRAEVEVERLRLIPILNRLDEDLLAEVADRFVTEGVVENRTVIHEGDPGDKFYIIVRGTAEVIKGDGMGAGQRLAVLQDGDHFGEIALLRNVPRTASVRTLTPTVFLTLHRGQFLELLEQAPHLRETLERINLERIVSGTAPA